MLKINVPRNKDAIVQDLSRPSYLLWCEKSISKFSDGKKVTFVYFFIYPEKYRIPQ